MRHSSTLPCGRSFNFWSRGVSINYRMSTMACADWFLLFQIHSLPTTSARLPCSFLTSAISLLLPRAPPRALQGRTRIRALLRMMPVRVDRAKSLRWRGGFSSSPTETAPRMVRRCLQVVRTRGETMSLGRAYARH